MAPHVGNGYSVRRGVWILLIQGDNYLLGRVNEPAEGEGARIVEDALAAELQEHGAVHAMLYPVYQIDCTFFPAQSRGGGGIGKLPLTSVMRVERRMGILDDAPPLAVQARNMWFVSGFPERSIDHFDQLVKASDEELRAYRSGIALG